MYPNVNFVAINNPNSRAPKVARFSFNAPMMRQGTLKEKAKQQHRQEQQQEQ
eukprot:m.19052 g.19052  ORF g.19052 m.19052 type:complete len:52 (+) comp6473_c0_seq1:546-701(+)